MKLRFRTWHLLALLTLVCLGFIAWELFGIFVVWNAFRAHGELSAKDWPWSLTQLVEQHGFDSSAIRAYHRGGFIDEEYLWRIEVAGEAVEAIKVDLGLSPESEQSVPAEVLAIRRPRWWALKEGVNYESYRSNGFLFDERGQDGEHFYAAYDPEEGVLCVWHKSNF